MFIGIESVVIHPKHHINNSKSFSNNDFSSFKSSTKEMRLLRNEITKFKAKMSQ